MSKAAPIENAIFNMDIINKINLATSLIEAKEIAFSAIESKPKAKPFNREKAANLVENAKSKNHLVMSCSNFFLAHDGLRQI